MKKSFPPINSLALAKETESPENPGALEKRVALIPQHIKALVAHGVKVFVEHGAGEAIGFKDEEYSKAGAILQNGDEIYRLKDMVIKFKGPSLENIKKMAPHTILFCMAHFRSFPARAELLERSHINVIAMEEILESPKNISDEIIGSKRFVEDILHQQSLTYNQLHLGFIGYDDNMLGGVRRAGNRNPKTLALHQADITINELKYFGENALYFYDSNILKNPSLLEALKESNCQIFDLAHYLQNKASVAIKNYRESHPPFEFGGRRIQCLHETGMSGARYGFSLLHEKNNNQNINACVLGYGNVGMGAIHECYDRGVRSVHILGRTQTQADNIASFLNDAQLIINGAEQAAHLRGVNYLIKKEYIGKIIHAGSVVIDLVGGSSENRSPVEDVLECTYLTNPHFTREGVTFSAIWGWPMLGMMKESAIKYSGQIHDVLLNEEKLLKGLDYLTPGVERALVCGPF